MPPIRILLTAIIVVAGVLAGGWCVWQMFRSPVADLPIRTRPSTAKTSQPAFRPAKPAPPAEGFVGSAACAECHAEVFERYSAHPMARSLVDTSTGPIVEDYEQASFDAPPPARLNLSWRYSVERGAAGTFHHETAIDPQGEVIYDQKAPIHYAVGSGQRGRSYLINRDGLLFMSSISWYSQKGRWNLSPGYLVQNVRFERRILEGCLTCHAGRLALVPGKHHCFEQEPFLERSIGCERCHGPGQAHIEYRRRGADEQSLDPIVNPSKLAPDLRDSVCHQCHFSGETRLTRYGRTDLDFRPGDDVSDIWTIFVRGTGVSGDTTSAVSQTEQMLSSSCYRKSDRRLTCTSCHDAHSIPEPQERIEFYRSRCLTCHEVDAAPCARPLHKRREVTAEDSCIECHMPRIAANDIPHTSQTDHRVLRSYHLSEESASASEQSALSIFQGDSERVPESDLERAWGLLIVKNAERRGGDAVLASEAIPKLLQWRQAAPDDSLVAEALGVAYLLNKEVDLARETWESALSLEPNNEDLLRRLVALYHDTGKIDEGVTYARRLVALNPWQHEDLARFAHMLGQQGKFDEAIAQAKKALEVNPMAVAVHGWLSEVYALRGESALSQHHQQQFRKLTARR